MRGSAKAVHYSWDASDPQYAVAVRTLLGVSGAVLSIVGFILAAGGLLSFVDGSPFYILAGLGLIVSGALIAKRHRAGAWTYTAVFAGTLIWSLRDADLGGTPVALRLVGPAVLLVILSLLMPILCGWRRRRTLIAFSAVMLATIALGILSTVGGPLAGSAAAITHFVDVETIGGPQ